MNDLLLGIDEDLPGCDDLQTGDGDFKTGESTLQHQRHLLLCEKNDYKENPTIGVGLFGFLLDEGVEDLFRTINIEFSRDGMTVQELAIANGKLNIDANY